MMTFENKVVLITGAASGIGAATAVAFAKLSAKLSLIDIDETNLNKIVDICKRNNGGNAIKVLADLTIDDDVKRTVDETVRKFEKLDVLVNCAGVCGSGSILKGDLLQKFDDTLAINLRSTIALTCFAANALVDTAGSIINISSVCATLTSRSIIPYSVAKAGMTHFTKCAALELAEKGVRVNSISPGYVKTPFLLNSGITVDYIAAAIEACAHVVPLKRVIEPEEIAELAVFLASEKASSITGADYAVDGGLLLSGLTALSDHQLN